MKILPDSIEQLEKFSNVVNIIIFLTAIITTVLGILVYRAGNKLQTLKEENIAKIQNQASQKIAEANQTAELAKKSAAEANLLAKDAEQQNLELRLKLADRILAEEQRKILLNELSGHHFQISFQYYTDPETTFFFKSIMKAIIDSGCSRGNITAAQDPEWIGVTIFNGEQNDGAQRILANALRNAGIEVKMSNSPVGQFTTIRIGRKGPIVEQIK